MNWHTRIRFEFARLGKQADESVVEEMAQHAAAVWEAMRADGETPDQADGHVSALIASWCAATTGPRRLERAPLVESAPAGRSLVAGIGLDFRVALRLLRRQPGFAAVSITLIALAIAATTSLFSVVNGVLLRPLPCCKVDGLVRVFDNVGEWTSATPLFTNLSYRAWADTQPLTIDGLGAWIQMTTSLDGPSGAELIRTARVTSSLFPLLGSAPLLGANFTEADERADQAVILSYGFWQERFGGAPNVLGQRLSIAGRPRVIVGVMPRGFEFPTAEQRVWLPVQIETATAPDGGIRIRTIAAVARLKPGATAAQAASEGSARIAAGSLGRNENMRNQVFGGGEGRVVATPMLDWIVRDVKPALWILLAAVTLLFAAAAGNVANMQLARAAARRREVAIRAAIGAGAGRLARQLLVETSTIAAIGGALGLGLTFAVMRGLPILLPEDFPRVQDVVVDGRVLAVVTVLTMATSIVMSLLPLRIARRLNVTSALADDGGAPVGYGRRSPVARARALIIGGQVAVAALLLVGAALLLRSFVKHITADRGYQPNNVLTARITLLARGAPAAKRAAFYDDVLGRLRATRGVTHAALTNALPLTPTESGADFWPDVTDKSSQTLVALRLVSADYFAAMGIRVTRGAGFTGRETPESEPVVVVNETFAAKYLEGNPLGAAVQLIGDQGRPNVTSWRVVGVVADVKHRGAEEPVKPEVFVAMTQLAGGPAAAQYAIVRTAEDPTAVAADLRPIVRGAGDAVLEQVMTMETRLNRSLARPRLYATLLGGFATFSLLIAAVGIFGGLSYSVAQRTREIGVRAALGATPRDIVTLVVRQGVLTAVAGVAAGLGLAAATVRALAAFLFGVEPLDPLSFAGVGGLLLLVAAIACAIPARRASKVDPIAALRG